MALLGLLVKAKLYDKVDNFTYAWLNWYISFIAFFVYTISVLQ